MRSAKQFWIDPRVHSGHRGQSNTGRHTAWNGKHSSDHIHVIEYDFYEALQRENMIMREALDAIKEEAWSNNPIHERLRMVLAKCTPTKDATSK